MNRNLETQWLQDFLMLAKVKNFSKAATLRRVTQPAFSRRIQALENALGVELIDRSKHPIALTNPGKEFSISARAWLNQVETDCARLKQAAFLSPQHVRIAAAHSLATNWLPQRLFSSTSPELNIHYVVDPLDVDVAFKHLEEGQSDLLLTFFDERWQYPPFKYLELEEHRLILVANTNNQSFELESVPYVAYTPDSYMGRLTTAFIEQSRVTPIFSTSLSDLVKSAVMAGAGVGWLPDYAIAQELESGQLSLIEWEAKGKSEHSFQPPLHIPLKVVLCRYNRPLSAAAESLWSWLSQDSLLRP